MGHDLYLLWRPNKGWGVFNAATCPPDISDANPYEFRKYTVPMEQRIAACRRLNERKGELDARRIVPQKGHENDIFPELSDLLAD